MWLLLLDFREHVCWELFGGCMVGSWGTPVLVTMLQDVHELPGSLAMHEKAEQWANRPEFRRARNQGLGSQFSRVW